MDENSTSENTGSSGNSTEGQESNRDTTKFEETEEEANWRQVKRKNKENKGKKEFKVKTNEREELDFHFDEELDLEVPTGRQNTFSNEW